MRPYEMHQVESTAVGDTFQIMVVDLGDVPEVSLVVTDANNTFAAAVQAIESLQLAALVPAMRVIGVGYPGVVDFVETLHVRARDFTPSEMPVFDMSAGAARFRDFLTSQVLSAFAIGETVLFGHSLGGLFVIDTLLEQPDTFDRYIASSPSLWWGPGDCDRKLTAAIESGRRIDAHAYAAIGEFETDDGRRREGRNLPDGHPAKPGDRYLDMVDDLAKFSERVVEASLPGLRWTHEVIAGEFHVSAGPVALSRGLRHFFADR